MFKKFSYLIYSAINFFDKIFKIFLKKSFLIYFKEFFGIESYIEKIFSRTRMKVFTPNKLIEWRVNSLYTKEIETLEWIESFGGTKNIIFWDIGANIGLYSLYNAAINENSITISFEPSTSNLRVLSRNISINKLEDRIKIFSQPLGNQANTFAKMRESDFIEGSALNSFGVDYNFEGSKFFSTMNYQLLGTSINNLLDNNILQVPNFIKIDVDGIEHLILKGADKYLKHESLNSISVELNENFEQQFHSVMSLMEKNNFIVFTRKHNDELFSKESKFNKTYNYVFIRK